MPKYVVAQGPLEHDHKVFEQSTEVDLPRPAAEPLLELGVVAPKGQAAPAPQE